MTNGSNQDVTQDSSSVYHLHPSDHTGFKFVNIPFDGVWYIDRRRVIVLALMSKNKTCFVDGTLKGLASNSANCIAW